MIPSNCPRCAQPTTNHALILLRELRETFAQESDDAESFGDSEREAWARNLMRLCDETLAKHGIAMADKALL